MSIEAYVRLRRFIGTSPAQSARVRTVGTCPTGRRPWVTLAITVLRVPTILDTWVERSSVRSSPALPALGSSEQTSCAARTSGVPARKLDALLKERAPEPYAELEIPGSSAELVDSSRGGSGPQRPTYEVLRHHQLIFLGLQSQFGTRFFDDALLPAIAIASKHLHCTAMSASQMASLFLRGRARARPPTN